MFLFAEEQISAMQQELDKYGIQMPAFGKIGGILANEVIKRKLTNYTQIWWAFHFGFVVLVKMKYCNLKSEIMEKEKKKIV